MISLNTLYDVVTPLLGLSSIALTVKMFLAENLVTPTLTDVSPMGIIMSLVGAFLLGLMRITNSIKSVEESNAKILAAHTELLKLLSDDSKKQDLILENQKALVDNQKSLLEIQNKSLELETKSLAVLKIIVKNNQNEKKPGSSGTFPVNS
jgi:hypothetical protein